MFVFTVGPAAAAAPVPLALPALSVPAIAFAANHVDATSGAATVDLTWTVADRSAAAIDVHGVVRVQQFSGSRPVGAAQLVHYGLTSDEITDTWAVSGDAQRSNYSYAFPVSRYGPTAETTWQVVEITAADDRGHTLTLAGHQLDRYHLRLTATGLVDSTAPTVSFVVRAAEQEGFVFDAGAGATVRYAIDILDPEAGFWKGRLFLTGPGGAQVSASMEVIDTGDFFRRCGVSVVFTPGDVSCDIGLTLPAGSPTGAWSVSAALLIDNAGNAVRVTGLDSQPVQLTRNAVLSATDFAVDPPVVNNWRTAQEVTVGLRPVGAQGGVQTFVLRTDCFPGASGPTTQPDGTVTVQWGINTLFSSCTITGIILVDGAGNVALYGSHFGAPALNLSITRLPDTTPPVALTATLSRTTATTSELAQSGNIGVTVTVDQTSPAPVTGGSVTFYDSNGVAVGGGSGGALEQPGGIVGLFGRVRALPAGIYTASFTLNDAAGLFAQYGRPDGVGHAAPSGPLVLTVVDG
jgi:hypothetical protein